MKLIYFIILGFMFFFTTHILCADNVSVEFIEKGEKFTPWDDMIEKYGDYYRQGREYFKNKEYQKAIECFKNAIKIDFYDGRAYGRLIDVYEELGDYALAIDIWKKMVDIHPHLLKDGSSDFYRLRSLEFAQQGIYKRAVYYAKKAYEIRREEMHKYYLGVMGASYNKGKRKEFILRRSKERAEESSEPYRLRWKRYEELNDQ